MNRRTLIQRLAAVVGVAALAPKVAEAKAPDLCTHCVSGRPSYRDGLCVEHLGVQARMRGYADGLKDGTVDRERTMAERGFEPFRAAVVGQTQSGRGWEYHAAEGIYTRQSGSAASLFYADYGDEEG